VKGGVKVETNSLIFLVEGHILKKKVPLLANIMSELSEKIFYQTIV